MPLRIVSGGTRWVYTPGKNLRGSCWLAPRPPPISWQVRLQVVGECLCRCADVGVRCEEHRGVAVGVLSAGLDMRYFRCRAYSSVYVRDRRVHGYWMVVSD